MIDCTEYCHHSRKKYQLVAWRQEYSNIKKVLLFFSWESDYDMFFNFAFYQKHLEFALYMVFWVHTSKFYFMPHCHICFRRQFLTPLPFQNLTQVHNFHSQDIYIINFQGNSNFFILIVAFRFRRGNQSLIFFYLLPQLISFMTELSWLIFLFMVFINILNDGCRFYDVDGILISSWYHWLHLSK